jgi:alpha-tubulin suppressor-like RCC1 family protein
LGEECDDENLTHTDGCELDCTRTTVLDVEISDGVAYALFSGGTVKSWGRDSFGQLGRGTSGQPILDPASVRPLDFGTERRVSQVSAGAEHACVLFEDGAARCWGRNQHGQLGIGSLDDYGDAATEALASLPDLPIRGVQQIAASELHTCALSEPTPGMPRIQCWGSPENGVLGIGARTEPLTRPSPTLTVQLADLVPVAVTTGLSSTCATLASGELICWGNNFTNGLAGAGSTTAPDANRHVVRLPALVEQVSGGGASRFCAFTAPSALFCWGSNVDGALGTPLLIEDGIRSPTQIGLGGRHFVDFQIVNAPACGLTDDGRILCIGAGTGYAGGYDKNLHAADNWSRLPHAGAVDLGDWDGEAGIDPAARVFVGHSAVCAEMQDGSLRCWGANNYGQLGYGFDGQPRPAGEGTPRNLGDDETPAEAYARVGRAHVTLW